ncbi:hypothetical protein ACFXP3_20000 [Streptomyces sp. NPDC059096]|uniref:hypothetical protein n=1 Tax=Streptomyces sp. NPDC059096 TaxID=3346727 RepID=UPI0036A6DEF2
MSGENENLSRELEHAQRSIASIIENMSRFDRTMIDTRKRVTELESPEDPPADWSKERIYEVVGKKWVDDHAAIADQILYSSTQALKFDAAGLSFVPEAISVAPQIMEVDANGIDILGVQVIDFFNQENFRNSIRSRLPGVDNTRPDDNGRPTNRATDTAVTPARAAAHNREIHQYKLESTRYFNSIKEMHGDAKVFQEDIKRRTSTARDEFVRIVRTIDEALGV